MGNGRMHLILRTLFFCFLFLHGVQASHQVLEELTSVSPNASAQLYRTAYHFQPPMHWINDPNGPMYYKGLYHLFYQYNPYGSIWGNIVWAHSISTDLINWFPLEPAIVPSEPFDISGCWSGSATILPGDKPAILYTGLNSSNVQLQNIAFPKDPFDPFLREWVKPFYNPLMTPTASNGINASSFRDPTTAWQAPDGIWRVVVGSKINQKGLAILYRSRDFIHWTLARYPLHSSEGTGMWECPDFYPVSLSGTMGLDTSVIGGPSVKHVLKVSLDDKKYEYYTVGTYLYQEDRYIPDNTSADDASGLRYDYGKFYASKTFFDNRKNRRILWGWINESDSTTDDIKKGWAGVQAIPRKIWLDRNGRQLIQWPIEELEDLRGKRSDIQNKRIGSGTVIQVPGVTAAQADVEVHFQVDDLNKAELLDDPNLLGSPQLICSKMGASVKGGVGPFGLFVLASGGLQERTAVFFRVFKAKGHMPLVLLCSDQSISTLRTEVDKTTYGGFVDVDIWDGKISLRTLIDNSIVESFGGGGRTCITARVYPKLAVGDDALLYAFNSGAAAVTISNLTAWSMRKPSIN